MEPKLIWTVLMGAVTTLVTLFGYSHSTLRRRMDMLEAELHNRPDDREVRLLLEDKLEPTKVQYLALQARMDELKANNERLDIKIDQLIEICNRMTYRNS